jgi:hypothetical protein
MSTRKCREESLPDQDMSIQVLGLPSIRYRFRDPLSRVHAFHRLLMAPV